MIDTVRVELGSRAYDVRIGKDLIRHAGRELAPLLRRPRVTVLTDETVAALHFGALKDGLAAEGISVSHLALPAGEATKSWRWLAHAVDWLLEHRVERGDAVIVLGGGVVGDLGGFATAILRRGVRYVQIPTTLLAQVDSSVGGKTGINSSHGKNLVGAFHQPSLVLADIGALDTLPEREFLSGYGEVVKYGLLGDSGFFSWLEANGRALIDGDVGLRVQAVLRSICMKAEIVGRDETERGERALLNLGHTFCHALEAAVGYSDRLRHGEGVAIGCMLAFETSARMGLCAPEDPVRLRRHLRAAGMKADIMDIPCQFPDADALMALMAQDKKVVGDRLRFILARGIGKAFIAENVDAALVRSVLADALQGERRES
ncbi:MAG: 3-dehydroquinate synthase [Rhodobacter sp.]|nr:3-dehydroquinate synthase [Rhodobacter sp.]MCY4168594.1 3-dehydroquinate synthase [Rhodobacter sp.]MCY4240958.1 3-dehydroquinate synthase [Rhodobacter sp.]